MGTQFTRNFLAFTARCQIMLAVSCAPSLQGTVEGLSPLAARDARVNISPLSGEGSSKLLALKNDGSFSAEINQGTYLVELLIPGYQPQSIEIDSGNLKPLKFNLREFSPLKPKTIGINNDFEDGRGSGAVRLAPPTL